MKSANNTINEPGLSPELVQLKASEARFRNLLGNLEAGIVVHAPDTSILMSNTRASDLLGLSQDQMQGKVAIDPAWKFVKEDKSPLPLDGYPVNLILTGKQPIKNYVLGIVQPGRNDIVWVTVNGFPALNELGEITEVVISFIDISQRKNFEILLQEQSEEIGVQNEELQQVNEALSQNVQELAEAKDVAEYNEARLKIVLEASKSGVWDWDIQSNTFYWSDEFLRLFGLPKNVVAGFETWSKALHPEDVDQASLKIREAIENHSELLNDYRIILPDRKIRWIRATGHAIYLNDKPVRMLGLCQDISDQRQLQELHTFLSTTGYPGSDENFFESLARYLAEILDSEYVCIDRLEGDGLTARTVAIFNEGQFEPNVTYALKQTPCGAVVGKTVCCFPENVCRLFPDDPALQDLRAESYIGTTLWSFDGQPIGLIAVIGQKRLKNTAFAENVLKLVAIRAAGELERLEAEINIKLAKEQAEQSDRLKSAFLANMSHEIRTPMNGILGFAELLKTPDLTGEQQQQYIRIIEKSGTRMLNIINDIIDISKIEAGLMQTDIKESNVNEQVEYIYTFFRPEADAKGLKLSFKTPLPAKEAVISTDREKLFAILTNLVKNAIRYTSAGTIEFGYDLVEGDNTGVLRFFVADTGKGIPEDRQDAIFERFIQADIYDTMAQQGAGLGLSITRAYVGMLNGKIWVNSKPGMGSTFFFTLPYVSASRQEIPEVRPAFSSDLPINRKLKILIAEDDEASELLMYMTVKSFSTAVLRVSTGEEAVRACKENPDIDLILMDLRMPGMDGYTATRKIREFNNDVIIFAQTAYGLTGDREKSIEAGCNDYLAKPVFRAQLEELVQSYFGE